MRAFAVLQHCRTLAEAESAFVHICFLFLSKTLSAETKNGLSFIQNFQMENVIDDSEPTTPQIEKQPSDVSTKQSLKEKSPFTAFFNSKRPSLANTDEQGEANPDYNLELFAQITRHMHLFP